MSKKDWTIPLLVVGGIAAAALFIFPDTIRWILFKENAPGSYPRLDR